MDQQSALTVRVCNGLCCELAGAATLAKEIPALLGGAAEVATASCVGRCDQAPVLMIGDIALPRASPEGLLNLLLHDDVAASAPLEGPETPGDLVGYEDYRLSGGYALATSVVNGGLDTTALLKAIEDSSLRAWGAAERVAAVWKELREQAAPRVIAVNIDEEPGSFKDRHYIERDPHRFLEGLLVAMHVNGCASASIHFRAEHDESRLMLEGELAQLWANPPCVLPRIAVREGHSHEPNVQPYESLHWVREIAEKGAGWFTRFGRNGSKGLRCYSVVGRVVSPGVKVAPAGITLQELIEEFCGGMLEGHDIFAWLPAGTWGSILPARLANVPLDHDSLKPYGCALGSAGVVVLSWQDRARCDAARAMASMV